MINYIIRNVNVLSSYQIYTEIEKLILPKPDNE